MAQRTNIRTTYEATRTIEPIYTGGSVDLSEDGRMLATCLEDDVLLTDLITGQKLARIEGDGETVTTLSLTRSGSHLIICSRSLSMRIYSLTVDDTAEPPLVATLQKTLKPHTSPVVTTATDRTGTLLATGGADGTVKVWDIRGGFTTHAFHGHGGVVSALHFFEVETSAAETEGASKKSKKKDRRKNGETQEVANGAEETTLGFRLASGGEDGKIRVWNLHKRNAVTTLDSHVSVVRSLQFSAKENALVSGSRDKTAIIWDVKSWKVRATIPVLEEVEVTGFLGIAEVIFTGGANGRIRFWTFGGKEITEEQEPGAETEGIIDAKYFEGLDYIFSVHADQTFALHSISPLEKWTRSGTIPPLPISKRISGTHDEVIDLAYVGQDRSQLALATNLEDIRIISIAGSTATHDATSTTGYFGSDVALLKGHEDIIICLDIDWSGHWLATGAKDNTARLWRLDPASNSYTCYATFTGHAESLGAIALPHSPPPEDSAAYTNPLDHPPRFLITGSQDKTIKRWDIPRPGVQKSVRAIYTRKAHDKDINALDTSPNSQLFASASQDRTVKIWSSETGETQGVLRGHRRGVWTVKFAPLNVPAISGGAASGSSSGSRGLIATGSGDKTVKIWSLSDYNCLLTFEGHTNSILKLAWLPYAPVDARDKRGAQVVSAAGDGLVKVWDCATGECSTTLDNHTDRVWALTVDPSSGALVSGGGDGVVTFWKDTTSVTMEKAAEQETQRVEMDQKLQNFVFAGNYREAITLALQLNQPGRLLSLFQSVVQTETPEEGSLMGIRAVDEVLGSLADEQLFALLLRIRDWNTNARTAPVAQRVLWTVVNSYPASRLSNLRPRGKVGPKGSLREVLDALRAYTERHYKRMEELVDESYLLDFTLREMDEVLGSEATGDLEKEVVMLES